MMKSNSEYFLDTSAIYYAELGHSKMREVLRKETEYGTHWVSNFVRMEYLRGVIFNLIQLYFLIKEEETVEDALISWTQEKGFKPRILSVTLQSITSWITTQDDHGSHEKTLRRLGDLIIRLVRNFDDNYRRRIRDDLKCKLGKVKFPNSSFDENMLLNFYEEFESIQKSVPPCDLCSFKELKRKQLSHDDVDLYGESQREKYKQNKGYVKQAIQLEKQLAKDQNDPKCLKCSQLGDTIIAVHIVKKQTEIVTADKGFIAFGEILGRPVKLLPSLAQLKRQI